MIRIVLLLCFALCPTLALAANAEISDCVQKSKSDGENMMAIARQCAGVKSSQDVQLVRQCVEEVRHQDGFNMPSDSAAVPSESLRRVASSNL